MRLSASSGAGIKIILPVCLAVFGIIPLASSQSRTVTKAVRIELDGSYLGIEMEDVTADNMASYKLASERGVIVKAVGKGSPAEAAGLQEKDVILEYGGTPVLSTAQFARLVRETPVGRKVDLVLSRDGKKLTLSAKIGIREGVHGQSGESMEIGPGEEMGRDFMFRMPGPRHFEFQTPDGGWQSFGMPPPGGRLHYFNEKPRLGVTLQPLTDQMAEFLGVPGKQGALVTSVTEGSPAAGKLKAGDVIIKADAKIISGPEDLAQAIPSAGKEGKIDLVIVRDRKQVSLSITLAKEDSGNTKGGFRL